MSRFFWVLLFSFSLSNPAVAKDAETFFLLDAESTCISSEALTLDPKHAYQQVHGSIEDDAFVVFRNNPRGPSDINDIYALEKLVEGFFDREHEDIAQAYNQELMSQVTPEALINILKSVLADDALLEEIADRSYIHVMGFTKIVLLTGDKDKEYKVRLHLWWPDQISGPTKLVLEDKHVHKWNFGSKMFSGSFEDQLYLISDVRKPEKITYQSFIEKVEALPEEEQKKVYDSISVIEMAMYGKTKFQDDKFRCSINKTDVWTKQEIMDKFNLNEQEFITVLSVHESYITKPNLTGQYGLEKIGLKHLSFPVIYEIRDGDSYYHHHSLGHRLISDPDEMVATFIITAPPIEEVKPYILMRSQDGEDITKVAPILDKKTLVEQLNRFIKHLETK